MAAAAVALPLAMLCAAEEQPPKLIENEPATARQLADDIRGRGIELTPNAAAISVEETSGSLAFVAGEREQQRVFIHQFGSSRDPIQFRVDADDRRGRWWDQARFVRAGEGAAMLPDLPADWLPSGRVVFLSAPKAMPDGRRIIAEIESPSDKVPLAVRRASLTEIAKAAERKIPETSPDTEIIVAMQLHAVTKDAPEKQVILPVMAAQDLTGSPRTALVRPHLTLLAGMQSVHDRMAGRAEKVEVTATLAPGGVRVNGFVAIPLLNGPQTTAAEAWRKVDAMDWQDRTANQKIKRISTGFSATLSSNDALVIPITPHGLFPDTILASMTAQPHRLARPRWLPEGSRSPIQVDGWVLTWPKSKHDWFASQFDYQGLPGMIRHALEGRVNPKPNAATSEAIGTLQQAEVEKLLHAFRAATDVSIEKLNPFEVQQHRGSYSTPQDRTSFVAGGEKASLLMHVDEKHISPNLLWAAPVLKHVSAPSGYGIYSGTSLCVLLPGLANPEKIGMLMLRCVNPDESTVRE